MAGDVLTTSLVWEDAYAVALALIEAYPDQSVEEIGYEQLVELVSRLPKFIDDPETAHKGLLDDIIREWYEEVNDA